MRLVKILYLASIVMYYSLYECIYISWMMMIDQSGGWDERLF